MWPLAESRALARSFLLGMTERWSHVVSVGQTAEALAASSLPIDQEVVSAAWLHDIGYAPEIVRTGMHALDGALALDQLGASPEIVGLVAHHTGARYEADERGLLTNLERLPTPRQANLDTLTMIDLATSPTGQPVRAIDRIAEILARYPDNHPVCRAVTRSQGELLASSARAKQELGLPDDWPIAAREGVADSKAHGGMKL